MSLVGLELKVTRGDHLVHYSIEKCYAGENKVFRPLWMRCSSECWQSLEINPFFSNSTLVRYPCIFMLNSNNKSVFT